MIADNFQAPATDEAFLREYREYTIGLVRKLGPPGIVQDAEDVAHDIMLRELEVGVRGMYNPDHVSDYTRRRVSFRSFYSSRVSLRMRGKREALARQAYHEVLIGDAPVGEDGTPWLELFGGQSWDDYSRIENNEFCERVRNYLATVPRRSDQDTCDLLALFDELLREVREEGEVSTARLQQHFQVADTTACAWLARLRQIMSAARAGELPKPQYHVVGGVTLSLADLRSAIDILRRAKGIMVRQPLAAAGHPLARAEKGWYHQFSRAEIKDYPEIAIDQQTHRKPAGHVKLAVLHRLERMLGIAAADSPAPAEPSPAVSPLPPDEDEAPGLADLLEAELWHLTPDPGRVGRIMELARQAFSPVPVS